MTARQAALAALERCRRDGAWSEDALDAVIRRGGLDSRDAALAQRLCLGVLQNSALCDYYADCYASIPTAKMEPTVRDILRLAVYQLVFLDRIPVSAAVNESVELCKASGRARAAGLVNAVLRRVAEHRQALPELPRTGEAQWLALRYSHPLWLCQRLLADRGMAQTEAFLAANNRVPPAHLQVNTLKISPEDLAERLAARGIRAEPFGTLPGCLAVREGGALADLPEFQEGLFYLQDAGARMAVLAADPRPGMAVLDACAAPGGKSFAAAIAMEDRGEIVARDIHENKLRRIASGAARLGLTGIHTRVLDARQGDGGEYDLVLADVPCSGLGVIRRKPDIRGKEEAALAGLPAIQGDILRGLADCVKPGGVLLYSTCTVMPQENEGVVAGFLADHPEFSPEPFALPDVGQTEGQLTLWPQTNGTDGFFMAKLRKKT